MKFRIHYTRNGVEDYFTVSGSSIEQVQNRVDGILSLSGLDREQNQCWSEEIPE